MVSQTQVLFLQEKIMELGQALFFNTNDAVLKLQTSVINVLHVDEAGQVWFILNRPIQNVNEFDKNLMARWSFIKKESLFTCISAVRRQLLLTLKKLIMPQVFQWKLNNR